MVSSDAESICDISKVAKNGISDIFESNLVQSNFLIPAKLLFGKKVLLYLLVWCQMQSCKIFVLI